MQRTKHGSNMAVLDICWMLTLLLLTFLTRIQAGNFNAKLHPKHEDLFSKLDDYRLVRPYRSTPDGDFISHKLSTESEEDRLDYFRVKRDEDRRRRRRRRDVANDAVDDGDDIDLDPVYHFAVEAFGAHMILNVTRDTRLVAPRFKVDRYLDDGTIESFTPKTNCFYKGEVANTSISSVAISNCRGLSGWIQTDEEEYVIEPLEAEDESAYNLTDGHLHVMYRRRDFRSDTVGLGAADGVTFSENLVNDTARNFFDFDDDVVEQAADPSGTGHREKRRTRYGAGRMNYVETMITVDYAMHSFHGSGAVNIYVITMMHIVNTAYNHPSLAANIQFVVVRIVLLNRQQSKYMVVENNAPASLTNVCRWAAQQTTRDDTSPEHHDHAIFITKENFGPAGYAPVTGMCAITRSCSLNKDEGLLSSFVIAHESGHVFGMEHDGQGNTCKDDATRGSIMAPVVISTYIHYFWSKCSKHELERYLPRYYCLWDDPFDGGYPQIRGHPGQRYTMDEQCRFDFGHGYRTCTAFYYNPCQELWCMHPTSYNCRTRNGPPLDGTACGPGRWCLQGTCRYSQNQIDGRWSTWSAWSQCPFPCGTGAQYRTRTCTNPRPKYGGLECSGKSEEYRLCNTQECDGGPIDKRAEQCKNFFSNWSYKNKKHEWLPYENRNKTQQCHLTCISAETGDVAMSEYNVTDGTPASYDHPETVCIKGRQIPIGCDGVISSKLTWDKCGVCGGDDSTCKEINVDLSDDASNKRKYKKMMILSPALRRVDIKKTVSSSHFLALKSAETGKYVLNPGRRRSASTDFILDGARFTYDVSNKHERLVTKGPIGGELYLMVYITRDTKTVNYTATYYEKAAPTTAPPTLRPESTPPQPRGRSRPNVAVELDGEVLADAGVTVPPTAEPDSEYVWRRVGWTKCNRKCGGGYTFLRHQCYRRETGDTVRKTYCGKDDYNPKGIKKRCNTHACDTTPVKTTDVAPTTRRRRRPTTQATTTTIATTPQATTTLIPTTTSPPATYNWKIRDWGECSATCGLNGFRRRDIYCTKTQLGRRSKVDTSMCPAPQPADHEECNRVHCPAQWVAGPWQQCSTTCGAGVKTREVTCGPPDTDEPSGSLFCPDERPASSKSCQIEPCQVAECEPLQSVICKRRNYRTYCKMPGYEEICCTTCSEQKKLWQQQRSRGRNARKVRR